LTDKNETADGSRLPLEPMDRLYISGNPVIQWLLNRLLKETSELLRKIDAFSQTGLDVGCGEGNLIDYLTRKKAVDSVVAIDLDLKKLRLARWQYPGGTYLCSDSKKLNFKDNSFDYVIASEVLEHIPRPLEAVREIRRVAKKDAYFIFSVPHEPFFRWGNLLRGQYWRRGGRTPTHVNFWGRSEIKRYLSDCVEIEAEHWLSVFPWMLYLGRFNSK
jgi:ubiquinone/menaquinone biosynthesis C-methylase UbiE